MSIISKKIDAYIIALLLELLTIVSILFISKNDNVNLNDFIMLGITFFIIIVTYTGGTIVGLITASIVIFLYASYIFYNNIILNESINYISYIWMISITIITFTTAKLSSNIILLQNINEKLKLEYRNLVTIDENTGLYNIKSFYMNLDKEISRARRHKTPLTLMMIKLPYYKEIKNIVGEKKANALLKEVGAIIIDSTRSEDDRYSIHEDMLGILMPDTDIDGANVVKYRIKDRINQLNLEFNQGKNSVNIDTKISVVEYSENIKNSIQMKELGEEELQYDV